MWCGNDDDSQNRNNAYNIKINASKNTLLETITINDMNYAEKTRVMLATMVIVLGRTIVH